MRHVSTGRPLARLALAWLLVWLLAPAATAEPDADDASEDATAASASGDPAAAAASEAGATDPAERAEERAAEAERRARSAERTAQQAMLRVKQLEERFAFDRPGLFIGGSAFYAPEAFEEGSNVVVKSSLGAMARIGYRVHPHVALDARFDYLDGFDLRDDTAKGKVDGYAITGNLRAFVLRHRFQPWIGAGAGAIRTDFTAKTLGGQKLDTDGAEWDPVFRVAAGLDVYLAPSVALSLESGLSVVTGDRDTIAYGQLGAGLDFRF